MAKSSRRTQTGTSPWIAENDKAFAGEDDGGETGGAERLDGAAERRPDLLRQIRRTHAERGRRSGRWR